MLLIVMSENVPKFYNQKRSQNVPDVHMCKGCGYV